MLCLPRDIVFDNWMHVVMYLNATRRSVQIHNILDSLRARNARCGDETACTIYGDNFAIASFHLVFLPLAHFPFNKQSGRQKGKRAYIAMQIKFANKIKLSMKSDIINTFSISLRVLVCFFGSEKCVRVFAIGRTDARYVQRNKYYAINLNLLPLPPHSIRWILIQRQLKHGSMTIKQKDWERKKSRRCDWTNTRHGSGSWCWAHFYIFARIRNLTANISAQQIVVTNHGVAKRDSLNISSNMEMDIDPFNTYTDFNWTRWNQCVFVSVTASSSDSTNISCSQWSVWNNRSLSKPKPNNNSKQTAHSIRCRETKGQPKNVARTIIEQINLMICFETIHNFKLAQFVLQQFAAIFRLKSLFPMHIGEVNPINCKPCSIGWIADWNATEQWGSEATTASRKRNKL